MSPQSLAADFFLIAHDPFDGGRLAISTEILGCGLVGAELADLVLARRLRIDGDDVVVTESGTPADEIDSYVLEAVGQDVGAPRACLDRAPPGRALRLVADRLVGHRGPAPGAGHPADRRGRQPDRFPADDLLAAWRAPAAPSSICCGRRRTSPWCPACWPRWWASSGSRGCWRGDRPRDAARDARRDRTEPADGPAGRVRRGPGGHRRGVAAGAVTVCRRSPPRSTSSSTLTPHMSRALRDHPGPSSACTTTISGGNGDTARPNGLMAITPGVRTAVFCPRRPPAMAARRCGIPSTCYPT